MHRTLPDLSNYKNLKVISFDIFDTAVIRRTFRPKDIYDVVEGTYGENFKELRMQAEKLAREQNNGECTLDSIYGKLAEIAPVFAGKTEEIKNLEIELELKYIVAYPDILNFYNSVKDKYRVIFISDMYLSRDVLLQILKNAGYGEHDLYISGELGVNKSEGKMFDYVLKDLHEKYDVKAGEILHIGDNYNSDILQAAKRGLHTHYIINNYDAAFANKSVQEKRIIELYNHKNYPTSFLTKLLTEKENSNADIFNKIGFYWGIIFYSFTKWVVQEADGRRILFNSRDGFIPHKIARCVMGEKNCEYVLFSRRSSAFIGFDPNYPINHEKNLYFYNAFRYQRVETIRQLLACIGFDSQKALPQIRKAGFTSDLDNIEPFKADGQQTHDKMEALLQALQPQIYDHCGCRKQELMRYIDQIGLQNDEVFCDIGYNGSIQYCIELLTDIKLDGKYFEVYDRKIKLDCKKEGFLSTGGNLTYGYGGLLETIFSAPHGGVVCYDNCEPLLFNDNKTRIDILNRIHDGIIEFCLKWHELNRKGTLDISRDTVREMVMRFLKAPTLEEAKYGLEVPFDNGSEEALENITWFNENRIKNGRILECYNRSYWKEAFLRMLADSQYAGLLKYLSE